MPLIKYFLAIVIAFLPLCMQASNHSPKESSLTARFADAEQLMQQQQWMAAAKVLNELLAQKKPWVEVQNNLAVALFKSGDIEGARAAIEQAVIALPAFKTAQNNRQLLYDYLAADAYNKALGVDTQPALPDLQWLHWSHEKINKKVDDVSVVQSEDDVSQRINQWLQAWSTGDVKQYFSAYATTFQPQANIARNYDEWRKLRLLKLKHIDKPVIEINHVNVFFNAANNGAIAEFVQHYQAKHYADTVIKQLYFVLQEGVWRIQSERVIEQLKP